jgi:HprK-related kinase A
MRVRDLDDARLAALLGGPGLHLRTGPFVTRLRGDAERLGPHLRRLYADHGCAPAECAESTVSIHVERRRGRPWTRQARLAIDGRPVMYPLAERMAVPMLEWGMNWVVATRAHRFLLLHAAIVERHGRALLLPGASGAGKTTLCALLAARGWRLFSDEFAVIDPRSGRCRPMPRALSLKNDGIDLARRIFPDGIFAPAFAGAAKGTLSYMAAPGDAVRRSGETAPPALVVLPRYVHDAGFAVHALDPVRIRAALAGHAMNYGALGIEGFRCVAAIADKVAGWQVTYGDTDKALDWFDAIASARTG